MTDTNTLAPTDQSRAKFDLWYADHIGDENKPVREAAWETWQHLYEQAAPAQPATASQSPHPEYDKELLELAREAGADVTCGSMGRTLHAMFNRGQLVRFAALVAAAEREACALACDVLANSTLAAQSGAADALENIMLRQISVLGHGECARAIRARSTNGR